MSWRRLLLGLIIVASTAEFAVRGVGYAMRTDKSDLSDPYLGARLWRTGHNPYDDNTARTLSIQLTNNHLHVMPIYPPTTYVLVAPLSLLPWWWASVLWALLSIASVGVIAWCVCLLAQLSWRNDGDWPGFVTAIVFAFAPLHTALHEANVTVIALALASMGLVNAFRGRDVSAGVLLALATCLKPQMGIWFLIFYLIRFRWRLLLSAAAVGGALSLIAFAVIPISFREVLSNYSRNMAYWFGPGGMNDFTAANPVRFHLVNLQVLTFSILQDAHSANLLAWGAFGVALAAWLYLMWRRKSSELLGVIALLTLSLMPFYHRYYDTDVLILLLAWLVMAHKTGVFRSHRWVGRLVWACLLAFLIPTQALLYRVGLHLPKSALASSVWTLLIGPHQVWLVLALSALLLYAMCRVSPDVSGRLWPEQASAE